MAHILLVEPNTDLARTYGAALTHYGHAVATAAGAQAAISAADTRWPNLVILELQLPAHNGIEFLYELRSYPEWQDLPAIVHSLVPPDEFTTSADLWQTMGVTAYLYKPRTSLATLLRTVRACLAQPVPI